MPRTTTHIVPTVLILLLTLLVSACGTSTEAASAAAGDGSAPAAASQGADGSMAPASAATASAPAEAQIDLSGVDACSLVDTGTIRQLTGASADVDYATDSFEPTHCFWGATVPGEPGYVELDLGPRADLSGFVFRAANSGAECPAEPIAGIGDEAVGGTCPASPQVRAYIAVLEGGVLLTLSVNEGVATSDDLAPIAESILAQLR